MTAVEKIQDIVVNAWIDGMSYRTVGKIFGRSLQFAQHMVNQKILWIRLDKDIEKGLNRLGYRIIIEKVPKGDMHDDEGNL